MTTATSTMTPTRPATTSGSERSAAGIGLRMPVDENDSSASSARLRLRCRKSRPTRMATRFTTSPTALPKRGMLNSKSPLVTPSATPAPKAMGRLSIPAMMAAASAGG